MSANDTRQLDTRAGRIGYREAGDAAAPAALFVHGVIVNSYLWRHQLAELSDLRRCIAVDLMGHGATEIPAGADVSFDAQADMLAVFLDALQIETVDVVANDSGTGIAQIFATRYPHRVWSLVLTNGDVHDNWPPADFAAFVDMVSAGGLRDTLEAMLAHPDNYRGPDGFGDAYTNAETVSDDTVKAYIAPHLSSAAKTEDLARFILAFDNSQTLRIENQLRELTAPGTVVWGTGDIFFPVDAAQWLVDTVPGITGYTTIDGARLLLPEEYPTELNAAIRRFWTRP